MQVAETYVSNYPTDETRRRMRAAKCLILVNTFLGKPISKELILDSENERCENFGVERDLRQTMADLYSKDITLHDKLLLSPEPAHVMLREWWVKDHVAVRDYSVEPSLLLREMINNKKLNAGKFVPIKHVTGLPTKWITKGDRSWPDPESKADTVLVELDALAVMSTEGIAAGTWMVIVKDSWSESKTHETTITTYDIVYAENGRLTTGHVKRPNHLPTTQVSKEKPKPKA